MIAMSTTCPSPVRSRPASAVITAYAVASAAIESASPNGGRVGGPSGSPVIAANPLIASARVPKPGRCAYGPNCPKPVTLARTSRGLTACSSAQPSPQRSSVPGRKFSMITSVPAASRSSTSRPPGVDRSRVRLRLLRPSSFHHRPMPSFVGPCPREGSGLRGCSTLITSAPKSPSMVAERGPAKSVARSTTRSPVSGACAGAVTRRRSRCGTAWRQRRPAAARRARRPPKPRPAPPVRAVARRAPRRACRRRCRPRPWCRRR